MVTKPRVLLTLTEYNVNTTFACDTCPDIRQQVPPVSCSISVIEGLLNKNSSE